MRRCSILHENDALKASTLLKLWDYKIPQHITVPLSSDRTGLDSICSYLFKKIRSNDKGSRKTTQYCNLVRMKGFFLDSVRVFRCPNSTIVGVNVPIDSKVGFVTPQNVPWPITSTTIRARNSSAKAVRTSEPPSCNRCTGLIL
ncbi:hypothetical protein AVEN_24508-1 [Araneus ventricosus]|uniref:Uncharacterized protein n=1 Tax=Araneus ventricosus TaxID=182803 RepID=A0A4Y2J3I2_ARAVE|nr:hypothetical protein AVEN_24508-1 [Araneus ventricosus]